MCSLYLGENLISGAIPNSANQSLSNLNSAGQDIIDGKVDLDYSNADYQPADTTLSNVSSIDSNSAVQTALNTKVNTADIWYNSSNKTLYIGVPQS